MKLFRRLRALVRREQIDTEMSEEMRLHLELQTDENLRRGLSPREARDAALREFGGVEQLKERARDARGWRWLEDLGQDLRFGARTLRREPGFCAVCVLVLALGIGANTAIFSVVDAVALRPLPVPEAERIQRVHSANATRKVASFSVSYQDFQDWARRSTSWELLAARDERALNLLHEGQPERLRAMLASSAALPLFGWRVALGQGFAAEHDLPGKGEVVLLADAFWRRRFNADPGVVGRAIIVDGKPKTVLGVLAPSPGLAEDAEVFLPMTPFASPDRDDRDWEVFGRLKRGVTAAQAAQELEAVAATLAQEHPDDNKGWSVRLEPLLDSVVGRNIRLALYLTLGAVAVLLAIACANFSGLLLVRAAKRTRELAIRAALGGGRWRLVRQLTTESLLLSVIGGGAGILFAAWSIEALRAANVNDLPGIAHVVLDRRVLAFAALATALSGLIAGVLPAWAASRVDVQGGLKASGGAVTPGRQRLRSALVIGQLALSIVLLAVAGVLLRTFERLQRMDLGFQPEQILTARFAPMKNAKGVVENFVARVQALPQVSAAGAISSAPMSAYNTGTHVFPVGPAAIPATTSVQSEWRIVTSDYFRTMQIPLVQGRVFAKSDDRSAPRVVVINQSLARQLWGDADPIGRQINPSGGTSYSTVIGVVGDIRSRDPAQPPRPGYYLSAHAAVWGTMTLTARVTGDALALVPQLRAELRALDPTLPLFDVQTMNALIDRRLGSQRAVTVLLGAFAVLALTLAVTGLYGVMAHVTSQRTREVGIRLALGARRGDVIRPLVTHGARLLTWGSVVGLFLAVGMAAGLRGRFETVSVADPVALGVAVLLLGIAALVACYLPARRASRLDPLVALRTE